MIPRFRRSSIVLFPLETARAPSRFARKSSQQFARLHVHDFISPTHLDDRSTHDPRRTIAYFYRASDTPSFIPSWVNPTTLFPFLRVRIASWQNETFIRDAASRFKFSRHGSDLVKFHLSAFSFPRAPESRVVFFLFFTTTPSSLLRLVRP